MRLPRFGRGRTALVGAAVALGLITTLAMGGTAATAAPSSPQHTVTRAAGGNVLGGTNETGVRPLLSGAACGANTAHWVTLHIFFDTDGYWQYWCYGYKGSFSGEPAFNQFVWACAGNNYGTLSYDDPPPSGTAHTVSFYPGWTKSFPQDTVFTGISITGWSGSYNC